MNQNWKTLALVATLSSATTLGAYKILGLDKHESVFTDSVPSAFSQLTSGGALPTGSPGEFTYAAEKSTPAVVHIKATIVRQRSRSNDPFFEFFNDDMFGFRQPQKEEGQASGSGVIISADGYIVTNNHVVADAEELNVILNNKQQYKAKVIGTDPNTDLAVIKVEAAGLPFLTFGDSDAIRVGEWVLAVGNPFELESTVTAGIVSAKGRGLGIVNGEKAKNPLESFIQTDAAVNPGNSGGALVNLKGELIGINTAIISKTGNFAGYSFAVPVSIVRKVSGDLLKYGAVQRGFLGVQVEDVNSEIAKKYDLKVGKGAYVAEFPTSTGSAAQAAGIKIGDVITKVDGVDIDGRTKLLETIGRHKPGDVVKVTVNRDGSIKEFNVTIRNINGNTNILKGDEVASIAGGMNGATLENVGIKVAELSDAEKTKLRLQGGAKIVEIDESGPLFEATQGQIEKGFIITKIDGQPVKSARDLGKLIAGRKNGIRIEGIYPDDPSSRYSFSF
jgi:serine protease Do